jgi:hypothetical protein
MKTIFSFSLRFGRHFIGNIPCSSDDSVMELIYVLHFFMINIFYKPQEENLEESNLENEKVRKWVPIFLSNKQETFCPERHEYDRSEMAHHLTGKLFPQGHDTKQCFPSCLFQTLVPAHHRSVNN